MLEDFLQLGPGDHRLEESLERLALALVQLVHLAEEVREHRILQADNPTAELAVIRQGDRSLLQIRHGKGGKQRVVPLGREAAGWLEEYLRRGRPRLHPAPTERRVFLTGRGTGLSTREALAQVVQRAATRAGVKRRVTPHSLRHAVATHMLRHGAGLRHLQEMLGHASAGTTQLYTRVEVTDLRRVHRRCHPRERGR